MCGRVQMDWEISGPALRRFMELTRQRYPDFELISGEKFPGDQLPLLQAEESGPQPLLMRWGFPRPQGTGLIINARAETAASKPLLRESLQIRRCLLPVTGFYEWAHDAGHSKYLLRLPDQRLLYLAALYQIFEQETRFVILTQAANSSLSDIHSRMPVIIAEPMLRSWLGDSAAAARLLINPGPQLIRTHLSRG
jgi:putative SOS response-associated peptidase YedK